VPTLCFTVAGRDSSAVADRLAAKNIGARSGHMYSPRLMKRLGLMPAGVVRASLVHYNTLDEIARFGNALSEIARTKRVCLSLTIAVCLSACRGSPTAALDAAAEFYVRAALALGERDADSLDIYYGPGAWRADARARHLPLDDIRPRRSRSSRRSTGGRSTMPRPRPGGSSSSARPGQSCRGAISFAVRGRRSRKKCGRCSGWNGRIGGLDGQERHPRPARTVVAGAGDLAARYAAFDRRFLVPRDRLAAVMSRAIDGCRAATREHVALPPGERVDVEYVPDLAWSAYTRYQGQATSRIQINEALPLTVDRALDLACHEAYPGHHTIDSLLDARFGGRRDRVRGPAALQSSVAAARGRRVAGGRDRVSGTGATGIRARRAVSPGRPRSV
jgi:hypothetical protein